MRQLLKIGVDGNHNLQMGLSGNPDRPIELEVTTPDFRFVDGNVSWHLVLERNSKLTNTQPLTDTTNWRYLQSDGSAMLYKSFTNSNVEPGTGAPIIYMRGLSAYEPPDVTANWEPIEGNLFSFYDLRFPWRGYVQDNLNIELDVHARVSLYASVLQSNPSTRTTCTIEATESGGTPPPEEWFTALYTSSSEKGTDGPIYWRIGGALIFEDQV